MRIVGVVLVLLLLGVLVAPAQRQFLELQRLQADLASHRQPPNGTEFIFARVQFTSHGPGRPRGMHWIEGWAHDYPEGEEHILQVTSEATGINLNKESYVIVSLESEEIFRYPFGYFSEVGEMTLHDKEVANLREWLNRGGFAVVDDFDGDSLEWFQAQMKKVFPDRSFVKLTVDHPLFHTFYDMPTLDTQPPYAQRGSPAYYGYFDDHGRLCMILNHNNDLGDFWEWIDQPEYDLAASTEGLRFGIDYFLYAFSH